MDGVERERGISFLGGDELEHEGLASTSRYVGTGFSRR